MEIHWIDKLQIEEKAVRLHKYMNTRLPKDAKHIGVQFFKSRFRAQGWLDHSFQPWPKRKRIDKKRPGRNILMDRGKLRNSIRGEVKGDTIVFGSDVKYAKIHNEGGTITHPGGNRIITHKRFKSGKRKGKILFHKNNTKASFSKKVPVGSYAIQMPKRQFMGESAHLNKVISQKIENEVKKLFK